MLNRQISRNLYFMMVPGLSGCLVVILENRRIIYPSRKSCLYFTHTKATKKEDASFLVALVDMDLAKKALLINTGEGLSH